MAALLRSGGGETPSGWTENFDDSIEGIKSRGWAIEDSESPDRKFGIPGYRENNHVGVYQEDHVSLVEGANNNKYLRLLLTQESGPVDENPNGVISRGALLYSINKYGYGTYEWRMRLSSTNPNPEDPFFGSSTSGSVSAGFIYVNNSETEIDFEFAGHVVEDENTQNGESLYMVNWNNQDPSSNPRGNESTFHVVSVVGLNREFHIYKFVWEKNGITFYVDGVPQLIHRTNVPSAPAHFMINHWGTNRPGGFGGTATVAVERYFYVDWVKYTPPR